MNSYLEKVSLDGQWQFYKSGSEEMYPVNVPGSVLSGLLMNDLCKDPFVGTNEYEVMDLLREDYSFVRTFEFSKSKEYDWELVMEGIDTIADVYLNGKLIVKTENMHRRYVVDVWKLLKEGENEIRIDFTSPIKYIENYVPGKGKEISFTTVGAMSGNQYIRKAHSMFGWDWGPKLPDMGIFRSIYLRAYENVVLDYIQVKQDHPMTGNVTLSISGLLSNIKGKENYIGFDSDNKRYSLTVTIKDPDGTILFEDVDAKDPIEIKQAKKWWPNRMGEHPLYTVTATVKSNKDLSFKGNTIEERIGLRTFTISTEDDEFGKEFAFMINGVKIFAKGADYIPEDCVYSRITKDTSKYIVDSSVEVGFNCLRIWGGGYYPSDEFYELCDEAGILLWQDFMFACNIYELTKNFEVNITKEATDNVRRLRNHASLGLWCGNNECESAWEHWGGFKDHSKALKNDYAKMFDVILPKVLKKEDGEHFYWPSSPSSFGTSLDPDADEVGDRHYWDVWHGMKPFTDYEAHFFRFCSEFGFQSFPEMATIKTFAKDGDLNIFSRVMESHQKNGTANAKILHYISENFLYPTGLENLAYVSQVLQGMAIKYGVEHWRRNRGRCMGSLYWQINDNWPVASWSSIDYYGRWKALHYMARHFYDDIMGSVKREDNNFTPYVSNETNEKIITNVDVLVKTMDNQVVLRTAQTIVTKAYGVGIGNVVDITSAIAGKEADCYVELIFKNSNGTTSRQVEPVLLYKHMNLPDTTVDITTKLMDEYTVEATVKADSFAAFVNLLCDDNKIVWDDNFFFITDSEPIIVTGRLSEKTKENINVRVISICDTYDK